MVACGTASYACMVARYWFEQLAGLPVDLDIGSEFRYRGTPLMPGSAALFVSQSGETMDTLEAMRCVKAQGLKTIAVVNVPESTLAREADCHAAHARRAGDRRRLDQGVHDPARDARLPGGRRGTGARPR